MISHTHVLLELKQARKCLSTSWNSPHALTGEPQRACFIQTEYIMGEMGSHPDSKVMNKAALYDLIRSDPIHEAVCEREKETDRAAVERQ